MFVCRDVCLFVRASWRCCCCCCFFDLCPNVQMAVLRTWRIVPIWLVYSVCWQENLTIQHRSLLIHKVRWKIAACHQGETVSNLTSHKMSTESVLRQILRTADKLSRKLPTFHNCFAWSMLKATAGMWYMVMHNFMAVFTWLLYTLAVTYWHIGGLHDTLGCHRLRAKLITCQELSSEKSAPSPVLTRRFSQPTARVFLPNDACV